MQILARVAAKRLFCLGERCSTSVILVPSIRDIAVMDGEASARDKVSIIFHVEKRNRNFVDAEVRGVEVLRHSIQCGIDFLF